MDIEETTEMLKPMSHSLSDRSRDIEPEIHKKDERDISEGEAAARSMVGTPCVSEIIAFVTDISIVAASAARGGFDQRMTANFLNPRLCSAAADINNMLSATEQSLAEFNRAMKSLADGDTTAEIRGDHHGAFDQLQKNINLAAATMRTVLGSEGVNLFSKKAGNFAKMLARFRPRNPPSRLRISDEASLPVASPARALRQKIARAFGSVERHKSR